jgi:hypothetical protein
MSAILGEACDVDVDDLPPEGSPPLAGDFVIELGPDVLAKIDLAEGRAIGISNSSSIITRARPAHIVSEHIEWEGACALHSDFN